MRLTDARLAPTAGSESNSSTGKFQVRADEIAARWRLTLGTKTEHETTMTHSHHSTQRRLAPIAVISLLSFCTPLVTAGAARAQQDAPPRAETVTVEFDGGTLVEFVARLRAASGANIVYPESAHRVPVPRLELEDATVQAALEALDSILDPDYRVSARVIRDQRSIAKPVHALGVRISPNVDQQEQPQHEVPASVAIFSLQSITEAGAAAKPAQTVLTAIETVLAVAGGESDPTLHYHEDSGLLFVRGGDRQIDYVSRVLHQMEQDVYGRMRNERRGSAGAEKSGAEKSAAK